jgi:hypothetical protein
MKKTVLILINVVGAASLASASDNFSYTATAAPGSTPDGVDQNSNSVNVWSVTTTPGTTGGGSGVYEGTAFSGETLSGWEAYSYPGSGGAGTGGSVDNVDTFAGGALAVGQTVSINFEMRALDAGGQAGLSLLDGSGDAITFAIIGQGPNNYYYTDAGSTDASAGSMGYQYQSEFNIAFTVTGVDTYSAVAGSDSWSGTFDGSLTGIDVFNHAGGNASDVDFNNLTVSTVPEPGTATCLAVGGVLLAGARRKMMHA